MAHGTFVFGATQELAGPILRTVQETVLFNLAHLGELVVACTLAVAIDNVSAVGSALVFVFVLFAWRRPLHRTLRCFIDDDDEFAVLWIA